MKTNTPSGSYAGIGSRETPPRTCSEFQGIAKLLAEAGLCLRSGAADGADMAFEDGCDLVGGPKEIFLPWSGFNGRRHDDQPPRRVLAGTTPLEAFHLAASVHPSWARLTSGARRLHARNCCQVLGEELDDPVTFVLCWTPDGRSGGGTGQALRIAKQRGIPIFDFGDQTQRRSFLDQLDHICLFGRYAF